MEPVDNTQLLLEVLGTNIRYLLLEWLKEGLQISAIILNLINY